jgi:DNA-directed RNA polymerase specialized sigma24 family protein
MNPVKSSNVTVEVEVSLETLAAERPANRNPPRVVRPEDPFTRAYRVLTPKLRAACAQYVGSSDVDDLVQDAWMAAADSRRKIGPSDAVTLSWLIGVAKRCAASYAARANFVPIDEVLAREAGDDLEGRAGHEDVDELRASTWGG